MTRMIKIVKLLDAPIEDVWQALTDKDALSEWLMPCDFEPRPGHEFQFRTQSSVGFNGIVSCKVLEIEDLEKLSFSWSRGPLKNTIVTFRLAARDNKTLLELEHTGFKGYDQ